MANTNIAGLSPNSIEACVACLYCPESYCYPYVDCVLRVVGKTHIHIFGFQIALQTPTQHKKSLKFFTSGGNYLSFVNDGEKVKCHMVWVNPQPRKVRKVKASDHLDLSELDQTIVTADDL